MPGRILLQMGDAIGHVHPERGLAHIRKALVLIATAGKRAFSSAPSTTSPGI